MTVTQSENKQDRRGAGAGSGLTERLARTSALHPWRTIGIWTALIVLAVVAVVLRASLASRLDEGIDSSLGARADEVAALAAKVDGHLKKMGAGL